MLSQEIYISICERGKQRKKVYTKYSGLHCHHIIPKHAGGTDDEDNLTYLTVREHIIAHYLLYRLHKHPNDLRSMHMLGARLSTYQRKITGMFCRDNKIGIHGASCEQKKAWSLKGIETQRLQTHKNTFYYWSTPEGRSERAKMGGIKSSQTNEVFKKQQGSFKNKTKAKAASIKSAKLPATNGIKTQKFHTIDERSLFIKNNPNWRIGTHNTTPGNPGNTNRRKSVKCWDKIYPSLLHAAKEHNVTQATIINWIRSTKKPEWMYAF
jgi:hypothetical protein